MPRENLHEASLQISRSALPQTGMNCHRGWSAQPRPKFISSADTRCLGVDHVFSNPEMAIEFEDESVPQRLARKAKTWIGSVAISPPLNLSFGGSPLERNP